MATAVKRPTGNGRKGQPVAPENQTPSEAVAQAIATQFVDLKPSVERIMASDLGEAGKMEAITLFQASLGVPGDPHRNPIVAIESGRLVIEPEPVPETAAS